MLQQEVMIVVRQWRQCELAERGFAEAPEQLDTIILECLLLQKGF
jgi:hypothetical protein